MRLMGNASRRLDFDEPVSRLAIWAKALAKVALALALVALVAAHARGGLARFFGVLTLSPGAAPDPALGLFLLLAAWAVAALALALALGAALSIWVRGRRGVGRIVATVALLTLLLPYPAWLYYWAGEPPFVADISTDIDDPPAFSEQPSARAARGGWTPAPMERARRDAQAAAYPEVKPMTLDMETEEAFQAALESAGQFHWTILEAIRPGGPARPEGHIEALAFSPALKLPVAIVIRVRPGQDETRVDIRAVTRYLPNDLGGGAALIGKLSDALEEKDDSQ